MANSWRTQAQRQAALTGIVPATESPVVKSEKIPVVIVVPSAPVKLTAESVQKKAHELLRQQPRDVPKLKVGDLILRPVRLLEGSQKEILNVQFGRSNDRKSRTFKARLGWEFAPDAWVATEGHGVVCFSEENPSLPKWTHFIVEKIGRDGKTAEVRPCNGDRAKLLKKFSEPGPAVSVKVVEPGTLSGS